MSITNLRMEELPMPAEPSFTPETWKTKLSERLKNWRSRMQQYGVPSVYAFLSAAALWPVVEAARAGEWSALAALGGVVANVGANLIANRVQEWNDEADGARHLAVDVPQEPSLRAELDAVLDKLEVFAGARQALPEADRPWFDATLQAELAQFGSTVRYTAHLTGSGAIAQGPGAMAAGAGGVAVKGSVRGNIHIGDSKSKG